MVSDRNSQEPARLTGGWIGLLIVALLLAAAPRLSAAEPKRPAFSEHDRIVFVAGAGEVRSGRKVPVGGIGYGFRQNLYGIHPYVHAAWSSASADYIGAGLYYDLPLGRKGLLTLSSGPGYFHRGHLWTDLGKKLEFYSSIGVARQMGPGRMLGLRVGHISNAGLSRHNPGSESVDVYLMLARR